MECLHGPGGKTDNSLANIRWGTPIENAADKIRDGTSTQGVRNPSARFDDDIIRSIRRERALGSTTISLAKKYNTSDATISKIVNFKRWKHIV
jgi:hypothetical protein